MPGAGIGCRYVLSVSARGQRRAYDRSPQTKRSPFFGAVNPVPEAWTEPKYNVTRSLADHIRPGMSKCVCLDAP